MGLFGEVSEEEKIRKKLIKVIKISELNGTWKEFLSDYVNDVFNGTKKNNFFTIDNLVQVILNITEMHINFKDPKEEFKKYTEIINFLLPIGEKSENASMKMQMFLDNFIGQDGIINKNLFDKSFYSLFNNTYDYLEVMNMIRHDADLEKKASYIFRYAAKVSPYCANHIIFKNEIISFITGLELTIDNDEYEKQLLSEAKKRCGIYPIDQKTLEMISTEAENAQALIDKL